MRRKRHPSNWNSRSKRWFAGNLPNTGDMKGRRYFLKDVTVNEVKKVLGKSVKKVRIAAWGSRPLKHHRHRKGARIVEIVSSDTRGKVFNTLLAYFGDKLV